jgi:CDP-4-dehydro-6-deoxyglucose reductase, E3
MTVWVDVVPSGHRFEVQKDETILEGALRSGLSLSYHCNNGTCGECRARVIDGRIGDIQPHDFRLSERDRLDGRVLLCRAKAATDLVIEASEAGAAADIPMQQLTAQVQSIERPVDAIAVVTLRTPRSQTLRFLAGQHVAIQLADLPPRNTSIASCPCNGMYLQIHQRLHADDPFSDHVFSRLKNREKVRVVGPYGGFVFDESSSRPALFIAYDTGFSAIKSLIEHAISLDVPQPIRLYWITRDASDQYMANHCRSWDVALDDFRYVPLYSAGADGSSGALDPGGIEQSMVQSMHPVLEDFPDLSGCDVYVDGPPSIAAATRVLLLQHGLPEARLFVDSI